MSSAFSPRSTNLQVQFGYTDTEGQLVTVDDGPLDLGTEPAEMKAGKKNSLN